MVHAMDTRKRFHQCGHVICMKAVKQVSPHTNITRTGHQQIALTVSVEACLVQRDATSDTEARPVYGSLLYQPITIERSCNTRSCGIFAYQATVHKLVMYL